MAPADARTTARHKGGLLASPLLALATLARPSPPQTDVLVGRQLRFRIDPAKHGLVATTYDSEDSPFTHVRASVGWANEGTLVVDAVHAPEPGSAMNVEERARLLGTRLRKPANVVEVLPGPVTASHRSVRGSTHPLVATLRDG